jgi:pimeloyl-ACP methyl ester carboxylesterase
MTEFLTLAEGTIAYEVTGEGPLVVLAHGMGDSRHSYRFLAPALAAAGYRVAAMDLRGCGESSLGWKSYSRTEVAGDIIALIRHLGGPAVVVGQSFGGGAATIAAATAPDLVSGLVELAPFTRKQSVDVKGLLTVSRHRRGMVRLGLAAGLGSVPNWAKYLDLAFPTKPADWTEELARIERTMSAPGRMQVLRAMGNSSPTDAGDHLADVRCPVLVVEGSLDPDWPDPRVEGEKIVADLPAGLGELHVIDGAGHYPHTQTPDAVLDLVRPFLARTLADA